MRQHHLIKSKIFSPDPKRQDSDLYITHARLCLYGEIEKPGGYVQLKLYVTFASPTTYTGTYTYRIVDGEMLPEIYDLWVVEIKNEDAVLKWVHSEMAKL